MRESVKRFLKTKRFIVILVLFCLIAVGGAVGSIKASANPSFCGNCHIIKPYVKTWESGELLAAKHGSKDVKCLDCHQQTLPEKAQEGIKYITGKYDDPLKEKDFTTEKCLKCHQKDREKMTQDTKFDHGNPHDSHLGEVDCHLCHKMHKQSEVYCAQCHDFDWAKKLDKDGWKVDSTK